MACSILVSNGPKSKHRKDSHFVWLSNEVQTYAVRLNRLCATARGVTYCFLLFERYAVGSRRRFLDGVDQDQPGYFAGRAAGEVDRQAEF